MSISQLIKDIPKKNLAPELKKEDIKTLGQRCHDGYKLDLNDPKRVEWAKNYDEWIKIGMQAIEKKSTPWPGAANIKIPLLIEACIQFNARALPSLVPSTNIVKCAITGSDEKGLKSDRGTRVGEHMSYQLETEMTEWVDDMDRGLLILPAVGSFFKKSFYNPDIGRNESRLVLSKNVILKWDAPSIDRVPRISEPVWFYPYECKTKIRNKTWSKVDIDYDDEDNEQLEKFITQHVYLDTVRKTGYMIPYIVTFHEKTGMIVRIVANYTEKSIYYDDTNKITSVQSEKDILDKQNQLIETANIDAHVTANKAGNTDEVIQLPKAEYPDFNKFTVSRIESTKYYTQYGFLPSLDKSIYAIGLGQLLGPISDASDTLVNQMLDAGTASILQGGFKAKSAKVPSGQKQVDITQWIDVETSGMALKDSLLPFNFPGPSAVAFSLLSFLIDTGKSVANLKDILSGDAPQGETATTSMIKREEGMRIYNAIYKRVYRSLKFELSKLYDLNSLYLPEETYINILDEQTAIKKTDYSNDKTDVTPTADPSESMQSQKIAKAEALMQFRGDPQYDKRAIDENYFEAIEVSEFDKYSPPPNPQAEKPDPILVKTIAEVEKIEAETKETLAKIGKINSEIIKNIAEAESKEAGPQLEIYKQEAALIMKKGEINAKQAGNEGVQATPDVQGAGESIQPQSPGVGQPGGSVEGL